jgi:hypothetical protein
MQIIHFDHAQAKRRITEPQPFPVLQGHYTFNVISAEFALLREDASDPSVASPDNAARTFNRQNVFVSIHGFSSARIRQSGSVTAGPTQQASPGWLALVEHGKQRHIQFQVAARAHPAIEHFQQHHHHDSKDRSDDHR